MSYSPSPWRKTTIPASRVPSWSREAKRSRAIRWCFLPLRKVLSKKPPIYCRSGNGAHSHETPIGIFRAELRLFRVWVAEE